MKILSCAFALLSLMIGPGCEASDAPDAGQAPAPNMKTLTVVMQGDRAHTFQIEVADDNQERARGLMFRRKMASDQGMLFDFGAERQVSMWMKNTYIPLDMLFIRADGVIVTIAENTEPHSLKLIHSRVPVLAVLELNGGTAARVGIKKGDRINHPLFKTQK